MPKRHHHRKVPFPVFDSDASYDSSPSAEQQDKQENSASPPSSRLRSRTNANAKTDSQSKSYKKSTSTSPKETSTSSSAQSTSASASPSIASTSLSPLSKGDSMERNPKIVKAKPKKIAKATWVARDNKDWRDPTKIDGYEYQNPSGAMVQAAQIADPGSIGSFTALHVDENKDMAAFVRYKGPKEDEFIETPLIEFAPGMSNSLSYMSLYLYDTSSGLNLTSSCWYCFIHSCSP